MWPPELLSDGAERWFYGGEPPPDPPTPDRPHPGDPSPRPAPAPDTVREPDERRAPAVREPAKPCS